MKNLLIGIVLLITTCVATVIGIEINPAGGGKYTINGVQGFSMQETAHYELYYQGARPNTVFSLTFEKVWKDASAILPKIDVIHKMGDVTVELERDEKGNLIRPVRAITVPPGSKPFKCQVVFLKNRQQFESVSLSLLSNNGQDTDRIRAYIEHVPSYTANGKVRTVWTENELFKSQYASVHISHLAAIDLLMLQQGVGAIPFWLQAAYGYRTEFALFKKCATSYLDYKAYYDAEYGEAEPRGGEITKLETFELWKSWAPIVKKHLQKGPKPDIETVLSTTTANLDPVRCGYVYAFGAFLVSDGSKITRFQNFLLHYADDLGENAETLLPQSYGYENLEAMQKDWHKWMLSSAFN